MSVTSLAAPTYDGLPYPRRYLAVGVLLVTLVLVVLDGAIANVALPSIAASLGADASDTVWVVSSYQLAVLVALLPCGALGEIHGPRRVFLMGVALFTAASAACAFAENLPVLIAARFAQGLGAGAIMALGIMNLRFAVPQRLLGTIIGINAMVIAISSAAGPGVAGAILSVASWPWLFAVNIPLGAIVLLSGGLLGPLPGVKRPLNVAALLANTLMFILFFSGADRIATAPISGSILIGGSILALVALLRLERKSAAPIVPTDLLAEPAFRVAVIASIACFTGQMLSYVALPFYLQHTLHMPPVLTGLYMMPWPAATIIVAPISGRLAGRIKTAWLCTSGGALLAAGLFIAGLCPVDPRGIGFLVGTVIAGIGFGLFQTPNNRILLLSAPKARSGAAGAMQGTARLLGQTFGAICMSIIFEIVPQASAPGFALVLAGICAAVASCVSLNRARYETVG
ncbi:DHA2 family multidrug resistance protein-like MFS transporter [Rhizobium paranaense]|uniref:DHA2 family multidrug resistance protein-like MFS transporter n=1 Tax=Rhizobium paranaense TaxID=1650438 RepID=A0A7W9D1K5_9HYPH|nr:MFS transporter [Rhizobium paranaense]MBB5574293.1 DHA2 family multidrug resistance protein-like MFS transporter [Rhizobium paranaense]